MTDDKKTTGEQLQPRLRFRGFTDPWEQRQFATIYRRAVEKNDPIQFDGSKLISVASMRFAPQSNSSMNDEYLKTYNIMRVGDIAFEGNRNKQFAFGRFVENTIGVGLVSHIFVVYRPIDPLQDIRFWKYLIYDEAVMRGVLRYATISATMMHNLIPRDLEKQRIAAPVAAEQKAIGSFMETLDSLITAAERHLRTLALEKTAYLQRLFTAKGELQPHTRFKGFSGDWEQQKLGDLFDLDEERNNGQFPASQFITVAKMSYSDKSAAADSLNTYRVLRPGDIAFEGNRHRTHPFGQLVLNDIGVGIMSPRFRAIRPRRPLVLSFWKCLLRNEQIMRPILIRSTKRGTIMNELVPEDLFKQKIRIPSEDEQQAIGTFFDALDSQISVAEHKLEALKRLKQGYLQQMFV